MVGSVGIEPTEPFMWRWVYSPDRLLNGLTTLLLILAHYTLSLSPINYFFCPSSYALFNMSTSTCCDNVHMLELPFHSISSRCITSLTIVATGCSSSDVMCCIVAAFLYFSTWISVFMVFPYLFTRDFSGFYMGAQLFVCIEDVCLWILHDFFMFFSFFHVVLPGLLQGKSQGPCWITWDLFVLSILLFNGEHFTGNSTC